MGQLHTFLKFMSRGQEVPVGAFMSKIVSLKAVPTVMNTLGMS